MEMVSFTIKTLIIDKGRSVNTTLNHTILWKTKRNVISNLRVLNLVMVNCVSQAFNLILPSTIVLLVLHSKFHYRLTSISN